MQRLTKVADINKNKGKGDKAYTHFLMSQGKPLFPLHDDSYKISCGRLNKEILEWGYGCLGSQAPLALFRSSDVSM